MCICIDMIECSYREFAGKAIQDLNTTASAQPKQFHGNVKMSTTHSDRIATQN